MARPTRNTLRWLVLAALALTATIPLSAGRADIPDFTWGPIEIVDDSIATVSSSSGVSVLFSDDVWHVVYENSGDIVHAARADTGWLAPEPLAVDSWASRNPHIARGAGFLHVVWEDDRFGHPEVWTRRHDANGWSSEECLTCDAVPSRDPVVAAIYDRSFVAWQEESLAVRQIRGRFFDTKWGPVEFVSQGPADAVEPTVTATDYGPFNVAWSDARHGSPEIYLRSWDGYQGGWQAEQRLTTFGGCGRPSIHAELCCGDLVFPTWLVAFERALGVTETYVVRPDIEPFVLSPVDGIPSHAPNADGFAFYFLWVLGGPSPRYFVTWTDGVEPIPATHTLDYELGAGKETLTAVGLSISAVGATEGNPMAAVMAAWVEDREGVRTLVTRGGRLPGVTAVEWPRAVSGLQLAVSPNPCSGPTVVRVRLQERTDVRLRIVDAAGRSIHEWASRSLQPGEWPFHWDARDAIGRAVKPGLYFASLRAGSTRLTRAFVVLR